MSMKKRSIAFVMAMILCLSLLSFADAGSRKQVNAASNYPYLLKINKTTNVVTVYEQDDAGKYTKPYKAFICSTGNDTPIGTFKTPNRFRWQPLIHNVWGQYCTQITGNILFHSVFYDSRNPADVNVAAYNVLGTTASAGCVRLKCGDAKWIYDNCPLGTTVTIFNGSSKDDPLGKPTAMKISTGWDPTDPDPKNPWHNKYYTISFDGETAIEYGTKKVNLLKNITLTDICGTTASKKKYVKVKGKVNTNKLGKYKVTYSAKDEDGRVTEKNVVYKVVDTQKPVMEGTVDATIERNSKFNPLKGVTAKMVSGKSLKKKIKVKGNVDTTTTGKYTLTYQVKGTNGKKCKAKRTVTVKDTTAPKAEGISDTTLTTSKSLNAQEKEQLIKNDITSKLQVMDNGEKVEQPAEWTEIAIQQQEDVFHVTVRVTDKSGNVTSVNIKYTVVEENATTQAPAVTPAV